MSAHRNRDFVSGEQFEPTRNFNLQTRWARQIKKRDKYVCQTCGTNCEQKETQDMQLHAHHIISYDNTLSLDDTENYKLENGATLCEKCHGEFHMLFGKKGNNRKQYRTFKAMKQLQIEMMSKNESEGVKT